MKIRLAVAQLFHAGGRTDGRTDPFQYIITESDCIIYDSVVLCYGLYCAMVSNLFNHFYIDDTTSHYCIFLLITSLKMAEKGRNK